MQVEVERSQTFGERRVSSRLEREPEDPLRRKISHEDPLRSVRKKSRKVRRSELNSSITKTMFMPTGV